MAVERGRLLGPVLSILLLVGLPDGGIAQIRPIRTVVAFGDSITWGSETSSGGPDTAYPRYLQLMYGGGITVINAGYPGEGVRRGLLRIEFVLDVYHPDLLLILEGVNDLWWDSSSFDVMEANLSSMAQSALVRNIQVVLGTITPSLDPQLDSEIVEFNTTRIPRIGTSLGIPVADVYGAIVADPSWQTTLMNGMPDPVHPNDDGEYVIAAAFKGAIDSLLLWQNVESLGGGWKRTPWFGCFYVVGNGWIYHQQHGWMYAVGTTLDNIDFYTPDNGWLWTSDTVYPYLYRYSDGAWLWYLDGTDNPRWFLNVTSGTWECW